VLLRKVLSPLSRSLYLRLCNVQDNHSLSLHCPENLKFYTSYFSDMGFGLCLFNFKRDALFWRNWPSISSGLHYLQQNRILMCSVLNTVACFNLKYCFGITILCHVSGTNVAEEPFVSIFRVEQPCIWMQ